MAASGRRMLLASTTERQDIPHCILLLSKYKKQIWLLLCGCAGIIGIRAFFLQIRHDALLNIRGRKTIKSGAVPMGSSSSYGETIDLKYGKHCNYTGPGRLPWLSLFGTNPWRCEECFGIGRTCIPLKRRGRCPPFKRKGPDETPRVMTEWSPFTSLKSSALVLHHDGHSEYAKHGVAACSGTLSLPCFDLTKCSPSDGRLSVFPYNATVEAQLDFAVEQSPDLIKKVDRYQDACLFVVGEDSFQEPGQLEASASWNGGQNHYIFFSSHLLRSHIDRPFNTFIEPGMAASSQWSMDDAYNREGYDTPLGLYPLWIRPEKYADLDIHRKRRLLLAFRGNIFSWEQRNWQHRWIASEYWHEEEEVHVDTRCKGHNYEDEDPQAYEELLLNSTFFFCPGGGGTNSCRFPEALAADAIPVVTSDFLPPFAPEIDWSSCIVRVSEARVVDIPRIVRNIPEDEVTMRQRQCAKLFQMVFGSPPNVNQHFSVAMKVWAIRIRNALRKQTDISTMVLS